MRAKASSNRSHNVGNISSVVSCLPSAPTSSFNLHPSRLCSGWRKPFPGALQGCDRSGGGSQAGKQRIKLPPFWTGPFLPELAQQEETVPQARLEGELWKVALQGRDCNRNLGQSGAHCQVGRNPLRSLADNKSASFLVTCLVVAAEILSSA